MDKILSIAHKMRQNCLSEKFVRETVKIALELEGVRDLMILWDEEKDQTEKEEIIKDIQAMVGECSSFDKGEEMNQLTPEEIRRLTEWAGEEVCHPENDHLQAYFLEEVVKEKGLEEEYITQLVYNIMKTPHKEGATWFKERLFPLKHASPLMVCRAILEVIENE